MPFDSMNVGVSGMDAYQAQIDAISNNIANVGTTAYKGQSLNFQDLLYQTQQAASAPTTTSGGVNQQQIGLGVKVGSTDTDMSQGGVQTTGISTNMMINGDGYFILANADGTGAPTYTRDGDFSLNANGLLYDPSSGKGVMGFMSGSAGAIAQNGSPIAGTGSPSPITIPIGLKSIATATGATNAVKTGPTGDKVYDMSYGGNLDSTQYATAVSTAAANTAAATSSANGVLAAYTTANSLVTAASTAASIAQTTPTAANLAASATAATAAATAATAYNAAATAGATAAAAAATTAAAAAATAVTTAAAAAAAVTSTANASTLASAAASAAAALAAKPGATAATIAAATIAAATAATAAAAAATATAANTAAVAAQTATATASTNAATVATDATTTEFDAATLSGLSTAASTAATAAAATPATGTPAAAATAAGLAATNAGAISTDTTTLLADATTAAASAAAAAAAATPPTPTTAGTTIYDSLGNAHLLTISFQPDTAAKPLQTQPPTQIANAFGLLVTPATAWQYTVTATDGTIFAGGTTTTANGVTTSISPAQYAFFDQNGQFINTGSDDTGITGHVAGTPPQGATGSKGGDQLVVKEWGPSTVAAPYPNNSVVPAAPAPPGPIGIDLSGMTAQAAAAAVNATFQNGYAPGTLSNISVGQDGTITGAFSNGQTQTLARVAVAAFQNAQGLTRLGGSDYAASTTSGETLLGTAGSGRFGAIEGDSLEMSNVSIADQFTKLITAQNAFTANSKSITTANENLQTVIGLIH